MTFSPDNLAPAPAPLPGPGREFTMRQVFAGAWQHYRDHWRKFLPLWAILLVIYYLLQVGSRVARIWFFNTGLTYKNDDSYILHITLFSETTSLAWSLLAFLVFQGYTRAVINSCDAGTARSAGLLQPWRSPWRWRMLTLAGLVALAYAAINVALLLGMVQFIALAVFQFITEVTAHIAFITGISTAVTYARLALQSVIFFFTLLIAQILLGSNKPTLVGAFRRQFQIIKYQWRRVALLAALWLLTMIIPWALFYGLFAILKAINLDPYAGVTVAAVGTKKSYLAAFLFRPWGFASMIVELLCTLAWYHLLASYFRAVYGLPLTPDRGERVAASPDRS